MMMKKMGNVMIKDAEINDALVKTFNDLSEHKRVEVTEDGCVSLCNCDCEFCDEMSCEDRLHDYIGYEKDFEINLKELQNLFKRFKDKDEDDNEILCGMKEKINYMKYLLKFLERG